LTPKHISLVVKRSSGKSATEWIEKYVILDAITQLTSTDKSIKEIAYNLGFPSQSFFGKYICRVVGTSPAEYRKAHKK
jgi:AraC-like DNA-binding protein